MKKLLVVLSLVLGLSAAAVAQPRAIGVRGAFGAEISYQHSLSSNFVEAGLGVYDFVLASPQWTPGSWNVYAGPGASIAAGGGVVVGICAEVGLEYIFESIPLQLSLDLRPSIVTISEGMSFLSGFGPSLGIRYVF